MTLLSPHELATLMLVRNAPDQLDMTRAELQTLRDRHLISLEPAEPPAPPMPSMPLTSLAPLADPRRRPTLTAAGSALLDAAARLARRLYREGGLRADEHFAW